MRFGKVHLPGAESMTIWGKIKATFANSGVAPVGEFFEMRIEDVFEIAGRGLLVTGKVAAGTVGVKAAAIMRSPSGLEKHCRVVGIQKKSGQTNSASAGENVGILLSGVQREDIKTGDMLRSAGV